MKNLKTRAVHATAWVLAARIVSQAVSFVFGVALAHLLVPDDFGLIAMVMVFTGLVSLLSDVGLGSALIQNKDAREEHYSSVFWLNILLGSALGFILFFVAPLLSTFYDRPEVENICKALSVSFLIGALALVPRNRLVRELSFKYIVFTDLLAMLISGAIAVALAAIGFGYWSLVVQQLSSLVISTALIWGISGWRPNSGINRDALRELLGFSSNVFLTQLLQYGARNVDKLLLGKVLGGHGLGMYDKAQSMMLFPLQNVSQMIGSVMFPSLSRIQSDPARVREVYLRSIRAIALLTFPMMAGMFVVANSFVFGVLGSQWAEVVPILRIFCVAGLISSIVTVTGSLYQSQGAAALQLRVNLLTQPVRIIGIIAGLPWGVLGVTTGFTIAAYITSFITLKAASRLVDLSLFRLVQSLAPIFPPTIIMAVLVWVIRPALGLHSESTLFIVQAIAGGCIYLCCLVMMRVSAYHDVIGVIRDEFVLRKITKT